MLAWGILPCGKAERKAEAAIFGGRKAESVIFLQIQREIALLGFLRHLWHKMDPPPVKGDVGVWGVCVGGGRYGELYIRGGGVFSGNFFQENFPCRAESVIFFQIKREIA